MSKEKITYKIVFFILISVGYWSGVGAQQIFLGDEISYNSNDGFYLMGSVHDTLMLFHENGNEYQVRVYKNDLKYLFTKEIVFEKPRIQFNLIQAREKDYSIIYSYEDRFNHKVRARKYNAKGELIDSTSIFEERDYLDIEYFSTVLSEDKNLVLMYRTVQFNYLELLLFDLEENERVWYAKMEFEDYQLNSDLKGILLSNQGQIILAFEEYNFSYRRSKHYQHIYFIDPNGQNSSDYLIPFEGNVSVSFNFAFDEKNQELVVAGLFAEKSSSRAEGYYMYKLDHTGVLLPLTLEVFPNRLLLEYTGRRKDPKEYIPDLSVTDIVLRNDGGMVLVTEMQKEILRESVRRRYVDYHYEDIILLSIHPEGELFWYELIRKYQLSYDDKARFSSYFLFETPSSLKIIFNDEIKSENTISEYTVNPLGKGKRTALFSTDLHRLKLVFENAKQISSNSFVVPSMYNSTYRVILIRY